MNLSKKLDDILASRWALWGISVIIASSMWYLVIGSTGTENETRKFLARVEFLNLMPQVAVKSLVEEVLVEVEAPPRVMENLQYDAIMCEVDLKGLSSGKYRPSVRPRVPQNVILKSVVPSELDIELRRQLTRLLPVEVTLPRDIPAGQYLEAVEVIPKEVNVRAIEGDMAKIGSVNIAPTFAELRSGKELFLPVNVVQSTPFEDNVTLEPTQVKINATLVTGMPRKKVPVNVRLSGKPSVDYAVRSLTTDPAEVMVQGAKEKLDRVSAADTETVDITNLSGDQTVVVPLRVFSDKGVSAMDAASVRLTIHLEPIVAQKQISGVPISVEGTAEKTRWTVEPAVADVTIEAPPSMIERFDATGAGLEAVVNVSGIFRRKAVLPIQTALASEDFKVVKVDPQTVNVSAVEE
jgi:YbbR domain-containing protein